MEYTDGPLARSDIYAEKNLPHLAYIGSTTVFQGHSWIYLNRTKTPWVLCNFFSQTSKKLDGFNVLVEIYWENGIDDCHTSELQLYRSSHIYLDSAVKTRFLQYAKSNWGGSGKGLFHSVFILWFTVVCCVDPESIVYKPKLCFGILNCSQFWLV